LRTALLVDGDEYLFKACIAVEREIKWDDQNHVLYCNENEAWDNFERMIKQMQERLGEKPGPLPPVILCWSADRPYFREDIYPAYKGGRSGRKPMCYSLLRERCHKEYACKSYPKLEADDCLGIMATKPHGFGQDYRYIMCSQDKDMLTIPGWRYDGKGDDATYTPPTEAENYHYLQTLTGDRVDNYPGCPGMGPVRAEAWLSQRDGPGEPWSWDRVVHAFLKAGQTIEDALLQGRLARILQWSDWDYDAKEPILWRPSGR
jgi:DNA polymerase-1